jgi:hypothetical protein
MLKCQDFTPRRLEAGSLFHREHYQSLDDALEAANSFLAEHKIKPLHVETVVLPNLWRPHEDGTHDASLYAGETVNNWNQFIRVWWWES